MLILIDPKLTKIFMVKFYVLSPPALPLFFKVKILFIFFLKHQAHEVENHDFQEYYCLCCRYTKVYLTMRNLEEFWVFFNSACHFSWLLRSMSYLSLILENSWPLTLQLFLLLSGVPIIHILDC